MTQKIRTDTDGKHHPDLDLFSARRISGGIKGTQRSALPNWQCASWGWKQLRWQNKVWEQKSSKSSGINFGKNFKIIRLEIFFSEKCLFSGKCIRKNFPLLFQLALKNIDGELRQRWERKISRDYNIGLNHLFKLFIYKIRKIAMWKVADLCNRMPTANNVRKNKYPWFCRAWLQIAGTWKRWRKPHVTAHQPRTPVWWDDPHSFIRIHPHTRSNKLIYGT